LDQQTLDQPIYLINTKFGLHNLLFPFSPDQMSFSKMFLTQRQGTKEETMEQHIFMSYKHTLTGSSEKVSKTSFKNVFSMIKCSLNLP
jgi:hypothetical protein